MKMEDEEDPKEGAYMPPPASPLDVSQEVFPGDGPLNGGGEAHETDPNGTGKSKAALAKPTLCCGLFERDDEDPDFGCLVGPFLLSFLIVVCGTASTVTAKIQYEVRSHSLDSCDRHDDDDADDDATWHKCKFTKPWFLTLVMKLAMSCCWLISKFTKCVRARGAAAAEKSADDDDLGASLLTGGAVADEDGAPGLPKKAPTMPPPPTARAIWLVSYPAMTDLLQTVLAQAGLLWVTSSQYQMMRGSVIVFTCFFSIRYMGKTMTPTHWVAIAIACVAIVVVGLAGILGEDDQGSSVSNYILGVSLIILGQVVGAVQFVLEEYLMVNMNVTPTLLVGWEGIWGVLYFVVLAPVLSVTPSSNSAASSLWHESFADTWVQLKNSPALQILTAVSAVALLVYNLVGNMVTKQLSAVMRSILESCRTLGVWLTGLVLWYQFDDHDAGEEWTVYSYLELLGFGLLVYGTVAYKGIAPIPGMPRIDS